MCVRVYARVAFSLLLRPLHLFELSFRLTLLQEANAAMGLNGQMLGDRALKVENAKSARETTPQGATNPYTAIQLQQMQQLQLAQMQSSTLAAQVNPTSLNECCAMSVASYTFVAAVALVPMHML